MREEETKPSRATEAVVYEFGVRWPCPRDIDPDRYDARLRDLMRLCAGMAPGLLRKAGDRVAVQPGRAFTLPSASELHEAADAIMADRAAKQKAAEVEADPARARAVAAGGREEAYRQINRDYAAKGSNFRMTMDGSLFRIGDPGEKRTTNYNGEVVFA